MQKCFADTAVRTSHSLNGNLRRGGDERYALFSRKIKYRICITPDLMI